MRVVICWAHISGYMSACWRALASRDDVDLFVLGYQSDVPTEGISFKEDLLAGLNARLLGAREQQEYPQICSAVLAHRPDVVVISGWRIRAYRRLMLEPALSTVKFVIAIDTPYRHELRQHLARFALARYLRRASAIMVAGERSWQLARVMRFPEDRIFRGVYGFDADLFAHLHRQRLALPAGWPKRFLFTGRYAPPKAIDVLLDAYAQYRRTHADAWGLTCCGSGPLAGAIREAQGVEDRGFVQPADLPRVMLEHGVLVLPSRYEPWGVVVAEAMGAGLPVICSEAVGASVELVRPFYNGLIVPTNDAASLASAMSWCHRHHDELPEMGARGRDFAAAFSAQTWADRWVAMLQTLASPSKRVST